MIGPGTIPDVDGREITIGLEGNNRIGASLRLCPMGIGHARGVLGRNGQVHVEFLVIVVLSVVYDRNVYYLRGYGLRKADRAGGCGKIIRRRRASE